MRAGPPRNFGWGTRPTSMAATTGSLNVSNDDAKVTVLDVQRGPRLRPGRRRHILQRRRQRIRTLRPAGRSFSPEISPFSSDFSDSDEESPGRPNATGEVASSRSKTLPPEPTTPPLFHLGAHRASGFHDRRHHWSDEYLAFLTRPPIRRAATPSPLQLKKGPPGCGLKTSATARTISSAIPSPATRAATTSPSRSPTAPWPPPSPSPSMSSTRPARSSSTSSTRCPAANS